MREASEGHVGERISVVDSEINPIWIHEGAMWSAPQKCPMKTWVEMEFLSIDIFVPWLRVKILCTFGWSCSHVEKSLVLLERAFRQRSR